MIFSKSGRRMRSVTALTLAAVMSLGMAPTVTQAAGDTYTVNVSSVNVRAEASTDSDVLTRASRGENVEVVDSSGDWYKVKYDGHTGYIRKDMLVEGDVATSSASSGATAKVTGSSVNIRKSASTSATVLERASKGTVLEAISMSDGWVKVKYSGVTGYVSADYVSVSGLSSSQGSSEKLTEMDRQGVINASEVNVREGAGTSTDKLYSLSEGAKVDVTGLKGDWYRVHTSSGTGYVLAKYVSLTSTSSSGSDSTSASLKEISGTGTATGNGINVRKSASTSSTALYKLSKGDSVTVTGKQGDWYRIKTSQGTGFVLDEYIDYTESSSGSSSSSSTAVESASGSATITGSGVNVRENPSTDADRLYQLDNGAKVDITGKSGDWYRISTSQGEGFVKKDFLDVFVATSSAIKEGQSGDDVKQIQQRLIELGYLTGSADGKFGAGTEEAVKAFQRKAGLTADGIVGSGTLSALNASNAPKADAGATATTAPTTTTAPEAGDYTTLKQGSNGEAVKQLQQRLIELGYLTGSADGDYGSATTDAVKTFQKQAGLTADGIAGSNTQKALFASDAPSKKTEADEIEEELDSIKSTLSMGSSGAEVKLLQERLISLEYMSGSADGDFGAKTREAVMLFQKQAGLTVDGKAGSATVSKLFSSSAENYDGKTTVSTSGSSDSSSGSSSQSSSGVIMADWWTSNIQSVFSRGTIATVTDVDTGISWKVKRRGGTNHADVEPLTAADTAKMKQAYGGSWSWNRRAIWVTVGGKTYAASMNGMPHGTQSITDNNFSGHHCIHFLNSRTHTGNRLDSAHQAAVKKAYEAGN